MRLNLKNLVGLLADRDTFTRGLTAQMLRGFGFDSLMLAGSGEEAKDLASKNNPDIFFIEGALPDMPSATFLNWLRRDTPKPLRFVPVIVMSGYTQIRLIGAARDNGAHIVIRKPIAPRTLFDRIGWVANFSRPFVESPSYTGPDRRFHDVAPPDSRLKRDTDVQPEADQTDPLPKSGSA